MAAPDAADGRSALFRFALHVPLLGALVRTASAKHTCGRPGFDPADPRFNGVFARYFRSPTTGLLLARRTHAAVGAERGVIYLLHGYGEHQNRYEAAARVFTQAGWRVETLDHQGHGQSEGDRAFFEKFEHLATDAWHWADKVVAPPAPGGARVLLGHSMGGLCALHVAHIAQPGFFDAVVLSGPGLVFDPAIDTPLNRFLAKVLSGLLPKLPVQALRTETLCSDPLVVRQYERDPLNYHGWLRVRVGRQMQVAVEQARSWAGQLAGVHGPLGLFHGEDDELCGIAGSRWLQGAVAGAELRTYKGARHEIFNEPSLTVAADVVAWLDGKLPTAREGARKA